MGSKSIKILVGFSHGACWIPDFYIFQRIQVIKKVGSWCAIKKIPTSTLVNNASGPKAFLENKNDGQLTCSVLFGAMLTCLEKGNREK